MPSRLAETRSEPDAALGPAPSGDPAVGLLDVVCRSVDGDCREYDISFLVSGPVFVLIFLSQFMHNVSPKNQFAIRETRAGSVFARHHSVKG